MCNKNMSSTSFIFIVVQVFSHLFCGDIMFTGCFVHLFGWKCSGVEENCDICEFYLTLVKIKILIGNKKVGKAPGNLWNIFEVWKLFDVKRFHQEAMNCVTLLIPTTWVPKVCPITRSNQKKLMGKLRQYFSGSGNISLKFRSRGLFEIRPFSSLVFMRKPLLILVYKSPLAS